jgi:hypothetical protein
LLVVWWFVALANKVDLWPYLIKEKFLDTINYGLAIMFCVKYDVNVQPTPNTVEGLSKLHKNKATGRGHA